MEYPSEGIVCVKEGDIAVRVAVKSIFVALVLIGIAYRAGSAPDLKEADGLFERATFQAALAIYEQVIEETEDSDVGEKAYFRACECLMHLGRYGEATERLLAREAPPEPPHRARFLILKVEVLKRFEEYYRRAIEESVIEDRRKSVFQLTPDELREEIKRTYSQLWDLRGQLVEMPIRREEYFLNIEDVDFGRYPTLFDYVILTWTRFLSSGRASRRFGRPCPPQADLLLVEDFTRQVDMADPAGLLVAELMEDASRLPGSGRFEARERWKTKRLLLPLRHRRLFDLKGVAGDDDTYEEDDLLEYRVRAAELLLKWMTHFSAHEARAEAGLEAARILKEMEKFSAAIGVCNRIERKHRRTAAAPHAKALRTKIKMPQLELKARTVMPPGTGAFTITTKNLKEIYFRAYRLDPQELRKEFVDRGMGRHCDSDAAFEGWSSMLRGYWVSRGLGWRWLWSFISENDPYQEWRVKTGDGGDHRSLTLDVDPPPLEAGIYLICATGDEAFRMGRSRFSACFLNVTELVLVGTSGTTKRVGKANRDFLEGKGRAEVKDELFRFYALDGRTGKPVSGAEVDVWLSEGYDKEGKICNLTTGDEGFASLPLTVHLDPNMDPRTDVHYVVDPLARFELSFAYWNDTQEEGFGAGSPIRVIIDLDRPIYLPGDRLKAKVTVFRRTAEEYRSAGEGLKVRLRARDARGGEFFKDSVWTREYGSASVEIEIPHGRMLGSYSLVARCNDGRFEGVGRASYRVEEYMRPEFEIELQAAQDPWEFGQPVEITGQVRYYFGGAVPDAPIRYRIVRQIHLPYHYRGWLHLDRASAATEVASDEIVTDSQGNFTIPFLPTPAPSSYGQYIPDISGFLVEVNGRDPGGRTIRNERLYKASKVPVYLVLEPSKGFYLEDDLIEIESRRLTVNDTPAPGEGTFEVFQLADIPSPLPDRSSQGSYTKYFRRTASLDIQLMDVPNGESVARGRVVHDEAGRATIKIDPLPHGVYRIVETGCVAPEDKIRQAEIFVVVDSSDPAINISAWSVTLVEQNTYEVGDTARFVIGSALGSGVYHVELWAGGLARHHLIDRDRPVSLIEIPVTADLRGGFALYWFGARDLDVHEGRTHVSVPWTEKQLGIVLEPSERELAPGREYTWEVKLTTVNGDPVRGEVLALMYDRSLEYYVEHGPYSTRESTHPFETLYARQWFMGFRSENSVFNPNVESLPITWGPLFSLKKTITKVPKGPNAPGMRDVPRPMADPFVGFQVASCRAQLGPSAVGPKSPEAEPPQMPAYEETAMGAHARKEFTTSAFFEPHLVTSAEDGLARFSFIAPERLTGWRIKAVGFTEDMKIGSLSEQAFTSKPLMVRVDLPRFVREGDRIVITTSVHNESDKPVGGEIFLDVSDAAGNVNEKLGLSGNSRSFNVQAGGLTSFDWRLEVPDGVTTYKVRAAVATQSLADAEECELLVLPSKERMIESATVVLSADDTRTLEVISKVDPARTDQLAVLQIDPQLASSILYAMPFLLESWHDCVEQMVDRYVSLSILSEIYHGYPAVERAVSDLPHRASPTPPWDIDDPRRLITLLETPWVPDSKAGERQWAIIDMLDPQVVEGQREMLLTRLRQAQLRNGAFPWLPRGYPDPHTTLYVLAGLAEARRHGVQVPVDLVNKALAYVNREMTAKEKPKESDLALLSLAAYAVTSYSPDIFSEAQRGHELAESWVEFLDDHIFALTPLAKAYIAHTHSNLDDRKRAQTFLDMAMDGAREDPITGVYWTPEEYSWLWYSDTIGKHAFLLRTLQQLHPDDARIPGMIKWLLFNRKAGVWRSPKASAAAIYVLLDHLSRHGSLADEEVFTVNWGDDTHQLLLEPDTWLDKPVRWEQIGPEITADHLAATIHKEGPGTAFASLSVIYSTNQATEPSAPGLLELDRTFYRRTKVDGEYHLTPVASGGTVSVGDPIEVHLTITTRARFEYMHLKDTKPAGFESETLLSGWKYDLLSFFEEPRSSLTNFFIPYLPQGEYVIRHMLRPSKPGTLHVGPATLQSLHSPDMAARSTAFTVDVVE